MEQVISIIKWLIILAVVFGLAFFIYGTVKINQPLATDGPEKIFTIAPGQTTKQIANALEDEGLINRAFFFELQVYLKKQGGKIQAGNYLLSSSMPIREIAGKLTAGEVINDEVKFTVLEGMSVSEIEKALKETGVIAASQTIKLSAAAFADDFEFLKPLPNGYNSLEGFLFPDTYFFSKNSTAEQVVRKMLANFDRKLTQDLRRQITGQNKTIFEIITLASIVEREVGRNTVKGAKLSAGEVERLQTERQLVAGVFYNRLAAPMGLDSDATVRYITGSKSTRATLEETKIDSPYNTYKYRGLPPGPIASPGMNSILATINPEKTDYLYFLMAPDGTAYFAKTLEEHNANRAKYLE